MELKILHDKISKPHLFLNWEIFEKIPPTTPRGTSSSHPTLTKPYFKNSQFPQTTTQSKVKPSVVPKYSQLNYQSYRPLTKPRQPNKQMYPYRNFCANHNYDFFANNNIKRPITKPSYKTGHQNQLQKKTATRINSPIGFL